MQLIVGIHKERGNCATILESGCNSLEYWKPLRFLSAHICETNGTNHKILTDAVITICCHHEAFSSNLETQRVAEDVVNKILRIRHRHSCLDTLNGRVQTWQTDAFAQVFIESLEQTVCDEKSQTLLDGLPFGIDLLESAHARCTVVNGANASAVPNSKMENLLCKSMFEHAAVGWVLEKHLISMFQLQTEKLVAHVQEDKTPFLHRSEFLRPVLVVHANVKPAPRRTLDSCHNQPWPVQRRKLQRPLAVPCPVVVPTIPQV